MANFADRIPMLIALRSENRQIVAANAADKSIDDDGSCSAMLQIDLRFFGIVEFVTKQDVSSFRTNLADVAKLQLSFYERHLNGDPIDASYLAMLSYQELFDALAACDFETAERLAKHMGGRPEIEKEYNHPFDRCLGYTLKAFVLDTRDDMRKWSKEFAAICRDPDNKDFIGYAMMFDAILNQDSTAAQQALEAIVKGHKNQSKHGGVFNGLEDEVLCVWGIGIANLARRRGLMVIAVEPLIPDELLCG